MRSGKVWSFKTARFEVMLWLERDRGYQYDGDDENGETQRKLDNGDYVAFNSSVQVFLDDESDPIGSDHLGGSVYAVDDVADFWQSHRTSQPEYRNTLAQKAQNRAICHYFPGMVSEAIRRARETIENRRAARVELPYVRT